MTTRATLLTTILIVLFSRVAAVAADPTTQPVDPAELVVPKSPPEFRQVVHPDAWQRRFDAALAELGGVKGLEEAKAPHFGEEIIFVENGGPAHALGIVAGEIITQVDDMALRGVDLKDARRNRPQKITVVGKNAQARILDINPGKIGVDIEAVFRPDLVYIRQGTRGPAWDAFAAIGAACSQSDPALAETAWRRAIAAGYQPDFISDLCGAVIAWRQGRNDEAVAFLAVMETRQKRHPELSPERWVRRIGLANFRIGQALAGRMIPNPPPANTRSPADDFLKAELAAHTRLPVPGRLGPSPDQISHLKKDDLLGQLESLLSPAGESQFYHERAHDALRDRKTLPLDVPTAHYQTLIQKSKLETGDVEVEVRLQTWPTDKDESPWSKVVIIGIVDCTPADLSYEAYGYPARGGMLSAHIRGHGRINIFQGTDERVEVQTIDARQELRNRQWATLRLIHAAGRDEVWLNQQRLLYLPAVDQPRKLGIHLGAIGMSARVETRFWKLNPPQP